MKKQNKMMLAILLVLAFLLSSALYAAACCGPNTEPTGDPHYQGPAIRGHMTVEYIDVCDVDGNTIPYASSVNVSIVGVQGNEAVNLNPNVDYAEDIGIGCMTESQCGADFAFMNANSRSLSKGFFLGDLAIVNARNVTVIGAACSSGELNADVIILNLR